jgi:hypothetical protein
MAAQPLDVGDEVRCRVVPDFAERSGAAGAALVKDDDSVMRGIRNSTGAPSGLPDCSQCRV